MMFIFKKHWYTVKRLDGEVVFKQKGTHDPWVSAVAAINDSSLDLTFRHLLKRAVNNLPIDLSEEEYFARIRECRAEGGSPMDACVRLEHYGGSHHRTMEILFWLLESKRVQ